MLNKIKGYIGYKMGIAQNKFAIDNLNDRFDFLAAYINLAVPEHITLDAFLTAQAMGRLKEEYPLKPVNTVIHKNDLMFAFHVYNHKSNLRQAVYSYFKIGIRTATNLKAIAERFNLPAESLLDFGSGYGRVSRFFPQVFPETKITISEVKGHSLKFQKEHFGFEGIEHTQDANSLGNAKFDIILALSVFTHLPQSSFKAWLDKLIDCMNPGGGLVFTFNNISTYEKNPPDPDFHYLKLSEDSSFSFVSDSLSDTSEYGSTYVSYKYLEDCLAAYPVKFTLLKHEYTPHQESIIVIKQ